MTGAGALLTAAEMAEADRLTIASGTPGETLMERAGQAAADAITRRWVQQPVLVLCGPGNNGGDGFVVARALAGQGWAVRLALLGRRNALRGDAAAAAARWSGPVEAWDRTLLAGRPLVVDAVFGAGLARPVQGEAAEMLQALAAAGLTVVAVDLPSGVSADTGAVLGTAAPATLTVTFFRRKPGHLLQPGRGLAGEVEVADIGIADDVLDEIEPRAAENTPALWRDLFPWPTAEGHKYRRGHAVVVSGARAGAGRLAAQAARRAGAGLLTILAPTAQLPLHAAGPPGNIVRDLSELGEILADQRMNALLIGPGTGVGRATRRMVLDAAAAGRRLVLDADALTSFSKDRQALFEVLGPDCVLTPHDGEYARLFSSGDQGDGDRGDGDRLSRARAAAGTAGAVVLLKGSDTVIAAPDGRAAINANAPPTLATGGTGDVLAGLILGLLAQGMAAFEAACAACWLHGDAAAAFGPGLIAEDVVDGVPAALARLRAL